MENNLETKEGFEKIDISYLPACFRVWFETIRFFEKEKIKVYKKLRSCIEQDQLFQIEINTKTNRYFIEINISKNHLDCIGLSKKSVSNEDCFFLRGKLNSNTFNKIMEGIVFYEAEQIDCEKFKLPEIIDSLKKGHIVTREKWNFKQYIYYNREKLPQICNRTGVKCYWAPNIEDLEAEDWIDSGFLYTGPESLANVFENYYDDIQIRI